MWRCRIRTCFPRSPKSNRRCIPMMTQRKAIADSDLEDGEYAGFTAVFTGARDHESSRKPTDPGKPVAVIVQKRRASAQRTQADHSKRESLMSSSSQEPRAYGKPDAMFSSRSNERGNQFENSIFDQIGEDLFLKARKIICSARQERTWWSKNFKLNLSIIVSKTPPDSELEDEQLRKMLASPLYVRERDENEGQARPHHSERESLMIHSSRNPETSGKPDAMFSCHSESSQNTFSERHRSNEPGNRFESSGHSVFLICWRGKCCKISSWWKQGSFV